MTRGFLRFTRESLVRLLLAGVFCLGPWAAYAACTTPEEADDGTPFARVQLTPNAILFFKVLADPVEVGEAFDMVVRVCKGDPCQWRDHYGQRGHARARTWHELRHSVWQVFRNFSPA